MSTLIRERAEEIVAGWREIDQPDGDNPAGPLFSGGDYAEQELTMTGGSGRCGTACTNSGVRGSTIVIQCC